MTTMRASIRDEVLAKLRGGNGPSSIGNVPTSSSVHCPDLDLDESFSRETPSPPLVSRHSQSPLSISLLLASAVGLSPSPSSPVDLLHSTLVTPLHFHWSLAVSILLIVSPKNTEDDRAIKQKHEEEQEHEDEEDHVLMLDSLMFVLQHMDVGPQIPTVTARLTFGPNLLQLCSDFDNFMDINSIRPSWRCPYCNQYVCFTNIWSFLYE
ncbi:hypothetical protein LguiB_028910 [Lonicera macranthoides]